MRRNKVIGKVLGIVLICLMIGLVINMSDEVSAQGITDNTQEVTIAHNPDNFKYPSTIKVLRTATGETEEVYFKDYVKNVLPNEWIASWEMDALKAGAMAVKTYAWYWTIHQKYPGMEYDVKDDASDQIYKPGSSHPRTDQAVDETWGWIMMKDGEIFQAQYIDGWPGKPEPISYAYWQKYGVIKEYPGRMSQWGTQYWGEKGKDWRWIVHYYYDPVGLGGVEPDWPAGKANICRHPWDGFTGFEEGTDGAVIRSTIPGLEFTTTLGLDWIYGDIRTGKYNVYPYGHQGYETNGNFFAWLGVWGDQGRIDFPKGTATYISVLVSTSSGVKMDAYDVDGKFLATSGWAENNLHTRTFTRLTIEAPGMAYVIVHDTGNYWLIDDLCTDAPGAPLPHYKADELAQEVIGAPYLDGGKGWNWNPDGGWEWEEGRFLEPEEIREEEYYYYSEGKIKKGMGLDCSGLLYWSYNKAFGAEKYTDGNPLNWKEEGAEGQWRRVCDPIDKDELRAGDLLFFNTPAPGNPDHVAMYVGGPFEFKYGEDKTFTYNTVESTAWGDSIITVAFYDVAKGTITTLRPSTGETRDLPVDYYGRLTKVMMRIVAQSPVDLVVTDPEGITITKDIGEVPGMYYKEYDIDGDGELDDIVTISRRKIGDYLITVVPKPDASPTDTYSLEVLADGETIVLAEDVQISDIPIQPYIVRSTEVEIISIIQATVDFDPDTLNLESEGRWVTVYIELPVGHGYDVSMIDLASVMLNSQVQAEAKPIEIGDYDSDGIPDLMVKFNRKAVQTILEVGEEVEITISGKLTDGRPFEGKDKIKVILPR